MEPIEALRMSEKMTTEQKAFWNAALIVAADQVEVTMYALMGGKPPTRADAVKCVEQLRDDLRAYIVS